MRSQSFYLGAILIFAAFGCANGTPPKFSDGGVGGGGDAGSDADGGFWVEHESFCEPCAADSECGEEGALCVELVGGTFCSIDCTNDPQTCPAGFTCQSMNGAAGDVSGMQCVPDNGICCVDADGDLRGNGAGCVTTDCDDENDAVYDDAVEVCDGFDNDCGGGADVEVTDCAEAECKLGSFGYFQRADEPCEEGSCTEQQAVMCGLYTCADGGEEGDECASSCDGESDDKCIPPAHCDESVCIDDVSDGETCDEDSDCSSDHCQNGFCCPFGDCCQVAQDCPTYGMLAAICDNPTTCQGSRGEAVCTSSFTCASTGMTPDDSACDAETLADDCDYYKDIYCTGATDQTAPACPTSCSSNADCDDNGHCDPDSHECVEDLDNGEACGSDDAACKSGHCQNGFCCDDGDCCEGESDCPASYSSDPTCTEPSGCQGQRDLAQCVDHECTTSTGVDDDSACGSGVLADDCGPYKPVYCDGNSVQSAPACPSSCQSDLACDADAYCTSAGVCAPDEPDGQACQDDAECQSGHCQNGFCCDSGDCCGSDGDCDAYEVIPSCSDPSSCQGTRTDGVCNAQSECAAEIVADDSGCGGLESDDCGPYPPALCSSATDQTAPGCAQSCNGDGDCDASAHCDSGACVPDEGAGGFCDEQSDCTGGLQCVDSVCCDSACDGPCEACDLPGSVGTCTNVPDGQDPDSECGDVSCAGYYYGFAGDTCYRRADVPASEATCDGTGSCRSPAEECPSSGQGPPVLTCDSFCQDPKSGTCSGTSAGACTNVDQGEQTCGCGACQVTEPKCENGVPNACTPDVSAASPEVCNDLDDDCDCSVDNGGFSDAYEPNGSCASVTTLATVGSDQTKTYSTQTTYGFGDNDYYRIIAKETDNICQCCDQYCEDEDYKLTVTLTVPPNAGSYFFCTGATCGGVDDYCEEILAGQSLSWVWTLDGACQTDGSKDTYETYYRIYGDNYPGYECTPYTLSYSFAPGCY